MSSRETYFGIIKSPVDALLIIEATQRNLLPRITHRLTVEDRSQIQSGSIFVYDELESGIRRWTDGRHWSPSRIQGSFLVYREVAHKEAPPRTFMQPYLKKSGGRLTKDDHQGPTGPLLSQKGTYFFKEDGLIKKTFSVVLNGRGMHLIAYIRPSDAQRHVGGAGGAMLKCPSFDLTLTPLLPVVYEMMEDVTEMESDEQGQAWPVLANVAINESNSSVGSSSCEMMPSMLGLEAGAFSSEEGSVDELLEAKRVMARLYHPEDVQLLQHSTLGDGTGSFGEDGFLVSAIHGAFPEN
jgi:hypothetical protein